MASTLAQGKPIAYLPSPTAQEIEDEVTRLSQLYSRPEERVLLERLRDVAPLLAWNNKEVQEWIAIPERIERDRALKLLIRSTQEHYDKRANQLRDTHPLGIQVNLETGVANGVPVVRTIEDCAELIRRTKRPRPSDSGLRNESTKIRDTCCSGRPSQIQSFE